MAKPRTRISLLKDGWFALHHASLMAGAEISFDPHDVSSEFRGRDFLDAQLYSALVFPLCEFAEVDLDRGAQDAELVHAKIWRQLLKKAKREDAALLEVMLRPKSPRDFFQGLAETLWARSGGARRINFSDPAQVARFCHSLIRIESRKAARQSVPILYGLAGIGAYWNQLTSSRYCEICGFRTALWNRKFCDYHSQEGGDSEDRAERAARYRQGKKVRALADTRGITIDMPKSLRHLDHTERLAQILYPSETNEGFEDEKTWLDRQLFLPKNPSAIARSFYCSHVAKRLGMREVEDFTYPQWMDVLREGLDLMEFGEDCWPLKVTLAERWFSLEDEVSPPSGRRGAGRKTLEMIPIAMELARASATPSEIARALKVSPSKITRMRQQFAELDRLFPERSPLGGRVRKRSK